MHELVLSYCNYHGRQWLRFPILPNQKLGTFIPSQCHPLEAFLSQPQSAGIPGTLSAPPLAENNELEL